ncbi:UNVERIFIED_CONTAM: hypothetical protein GTU68_054857, partial [Idotea baltica]|nr:hypothetical protein [Idotea baltica]
MNLEDREELPKLFKNESFDVICNLAAQAGVRYSLENPESYVDSNLVGFLNILECCRNYKIKHLVYASSSSVYGLNKKIPFSTDDNVDHPISLYAATKKSNELMAHTYSHLFKIPTTGLRYFNVFGRRQDPNGAYAAVIPLFVKQFINHESPMINGDGSFSRDFTYIDNVVQMNLLAITTENKDALNTVYNVAYGDRTTLLEL